MDNITRTVPETVFFSESTFVGEMVGINVWDRVLSEAEISEMSKSCTSGKGNIVSMVDLMVMGGERKSLSLVKLAIIPPEFAVIDGVDRMIFFSFQSFSCVLNFPFRVFFFGRKIWQVYFG